jgi:hypothetical protein
MLRADGPILETRTLEGTNGRTSFRCPLFSLFDDSYRILYLYLPLTYFAFRHLVLLFLMGFTDGF